MIGVIPPIEVIDTLLTLFPSGFLIILFLFIFLHFNLFPISMLGVKTISPNGLYPLHILLINWKFFKTLEEKNSTNKKNNQKSKIETIFHHLCQVDPTGKIFLYYFFSLNV